MSSSLSAPNPYRCQIFHLKCTEFNFGLDSATDPAGEFTTYLQTPSWVWGKGREKCGRGKKEEMKNKWVENGDGREIEGKIGKGRGRRGGGRRNGGRGRGREREEANFSIPTFFPACAPAVHRV